MAKYSVSTKLGRWCADRQLNFSEGARRIGTVPDTFRRYALGTRLPRPQHMVAIYVLTQGQVTPNDFHDLPALPETDDARAA